MNHLLYKIQPFACLLLLLVSHNIHAFDLEYDFWVGKSAVRRTPSPEPFAFVPGCGRVVHNACAASSTCPCCSNPILKNYSHRLLSCAAISDEKKLAKALAQACIFCKLPCDPDIKITTPHFGMCIKTKEVYHSRCIERMGQCPTCKSMDFYPNLKLPDCEALGGRIREKCSGCKTDLIEE